MFIKIFDNKKYEMYVNFGLCVYILIHLINMLTNGLFYKYQIAIGLEKHWFLIGREFALACWFGWENLNTLQSNVKKQLNQNGWMVVC